MKKIMFLMLAFTFLLTACKSDDEQIIVKKAEDYQADNVKKPDSTVETPNSIEDNVETPNPMEDDVDIADYFANNNNEVLMFSDSEPISFHFIEGREIENINEITDSLMMYDYFHKNNGIDTFYSLLQYIGIYDISIPQFYFFDNPLSEKINEYLKKNYYDKYTKMKADEYAELEIIFSKYDYDLEILRKKYGERSMEKGPTYHIFKSTVLRNDNDVISIIFRDVSTGSSAFTYPSFINFDVETGEKINIDDVFSVPKSEYLPIIGELMEISRYGYTAKDYSSGNFENPHVGSDINAIQNEFFPEDFTLNKDSITICYSLIKSGVSSCTAEGHVFFTIPFILISDILNDKYK